MRTKDISQFLIVDCFGGEPFKHYQILYSTFKEKEEGENLELLDQFREEVLSTKYTSGLRRYIEERAKGEFPEYEFKWGPRNNYESKPRNGKEIYISFE